MKKLFMSVALLLLAVTSFAQTPGYEFTTVVSHKATPVKDQGSTGTCWCFATASFMESELLRMGKGEYDLSEMFIVRQNLKETSETAYNKAFWRFFFFGGAEIGAEFQENHKY